MKKVLSSSADVRQAIIGLFRSSNRRRAAISAFVGDGAEAYFPKPKGLELFCWPENQTELQRIWSYTRSCRNPFTAPFNILAKKTLIGILIGFTELATLILTQKQSLDHSNLPRHYKSSINSKWQHAPREASRTLKIRIHKERTIADEIAEQMKSEPYDLLE